MLIFFFAVHYHDDDNDENQGEIRVFIYNGVVAMSWKQ